MEPSAPTVDPQATQSLEFDSLLLVMWRNYQIIIGGTILAVVVGFLYLAKAVPIFVSTARIYVEQSGPKIMGELEEGVMTGNKNYLHTQAELIKSSPILLGALKKCNAGRMPTFADADNPLSFLQHEISATVGRKDDIIAVSFKSPYPLEAAHIVNTVIDSYVTFHAERKRSTASEVLKILQKEMATRSQELSENLRAMVDFKENNVEMALQTEQGHITLDRLSQLSQAVTQAQLATVDAKSCYESSREMMNDPRKLRQFILAQESSRLLQMPGSEKSRLRAELKQRRARRSDRLRQLTADHPGVRALDIEIEEIEQQIIQIDEEFVQAQLAALEQQYLNAQETERQLASHFTEQRELALELNRQVSQYTLLRSEWEQSKKTCDILNDRIKELNVTEDAGVLNITVLEVARPADEPSEPQKARTMTVALLLGLMLGGGGAFLKDMMDHRIRSADELAALLHAPLLGTVPAMPKRYSVSQRGRKVLSESHSNTAEAFRTIRTALFFSVPQEQGRILHVTSAVAGEGKSTFVSNLAIAIAQSGQRVLIIDADLRRPTQHVIFGVNKESGLSAVLAGLRDIKQAIIQTEVDGLYLLPCGPSVPDPSEILGRRAFETLLAQLVEEYDRILVDSPPVVPVADGSILSTRCDATILVSRARQTSRKALLQAASTLVSVRASVIGAVFNDVRQHKGRYGYYEYGHSDGHGVNHGSKHNGGSKGKPKLVAAINSARMRAVPQRETA